VHLQKVDLQFVGPEERLQQLRLEIAEIEAGLKETAGGKASAGSDPRRASAWDGLASTLNWAGEKALQGVDGIVLAVGGEDESKKLLEVPQAKSKERRSQSPRLPWKEEEPPTVQSSSSKAVKDGQEEHGDGPAVGFFGAVALAAAALSAPPSPRSGEDAENQDGGGQCVPVDGRAHHAAVRDRRHRRHVHIAKRLTVVDEQAERPGGPPSE